MNPPRFMQRARLAGVALVAPLVVTVSGCGATPDTAATSSPTAPSPSSSVASPRNSVPATQQVSADDAALEHIHNIALVDGDTVIIGSHEGVYRQPPGQAPELIGQPFDVMGLATTDTRWYASGHPGPQMQAPADLGLLQSSDAGRSWSELALAGQVDFHRLAVSGKVVLGVNSGDGQLWRSGDGGEQWEQVGPGPYDVALDPTDPKSAVATTQDGPLRSTDGGRSWSQVGGAPVVALLAWTQDALFGVTPEGRVQRSDDAGATWSAQGTVDGGQPAALAATGEQVIALAGDTVWESRDGGQTFVPRITDLPSGH